MKARIALALPALIALALLGGCAPATPTTKPVPADNPSLTTTATPVESNADELYQYSTLNALMAGVFDGDKPVGEIASQGDLGLGTLNALDGEMVMVDGATYQVRSDGKVAAVPSDTLTPFAAVTFFESDTTQPAAGAKTLDQLKALIDAKRTSENLPYAIKISGTFASVKTRSVPAQTKPYPTLLKALESQEEFELKDVKGTLVGFWLPAYMNGPNAAGYHLHFITDARDAGGHVLDCKSSDVTIALDETSDWNVELPTEGAFLDTQLSGEQYK